MGLLYLLLKITGLCILNLCLRRLVKENVSFAKIEQLNYVTFQHYIYLRFGVHVVVIIKIAVCQDAAFILTIKY
jgi:hypothetical protein